MDILALLDGIRAIAQDGLRYAADPYDRERYEHLLRLASLSYAELLEAPEPAIRARLLNEIGPVTPKVGAEAAIFNQNGELLLMERSDGSGWCLPCGLVEPNEKPAQAAVRETREETGLEVEVVRLVGVFTRLPGLNSGVHTTIGILHLCRVTGGDLQLSAEGRDLRYRPIDEVRDWHPGHERYARTAYAAWRSEQWLPAISD